jgi:hypothetical protein
MTDAVANVVLDSKVTTPQVVYKTLEVNPNRSVAEIVVTLKYDRYLEGRKLRNNYRNFDDFFGAWEWVILSNTRADSFWAESNGFEESNLEHLLEFALQFPDMQKKEKIRSRFMPIDFQTQAVVLLPDPVWNTRVLYVRRFSEPLAFVAP